MFKVKNTTNGKLLISDLNIMIQGNAEIDLDACCTRDKIDKSQTLLILLTQKKLITIHKDTLFKDASLNEMETRIREQLKSQMIHLPEPEKNENKEIAELKDKLDLLIKHVTSQPVQNPPNTSKNIPQKEDDTSEFSVDIQEKLIKRLSKNVESKVDTKEEVNKSDIQDKANELEGFI